MGVPQGIYYNYVNWNVNKFPWDLLIFGIYELGDFTKLT